MVRMITLFTTELLNIVIVIRNQNNIGMLQEEIVVAICMGTEEYVGVEQDASTRGLLLHYKNTTKSLV